MPEQVKVNKWENIDTKIVRANRQTPCQVRYYIYNDPNDTKEDEVYVPKDANLQKEFPGAVLYPKDICFASLLAGLHTHKKANRIWYKPNYKLSKDICEKWVEICIGARMLPNYSKLENLDTGFVMKLDVDISPSLLYIYLCSMRAIDEEPDFVRSVVHLVDKHEMDVYAAHVFAAKTALFSAGHWYIETYKGYGGAPFNINKHKVSIAYMIQLRRYLVNPRNYDTREVHDMEHWGNAYGFNAISTMKTISDVKFMVAVKHVYRPSILRIIYSNTEEEAQTNIKRVLERWARIKKEREEAGNKQITEEKKVA